MNFKLLLVKVCSFVVAISCLINSAHAGVISGDITKTYNGYSVTGDLQGLEWLSWDETFGYSASEILNGTGNSFLEDGWRYASKSESMVLFDSLGFISGWHSGNASSAPAAADWLWEVFDYPDYLTQKSGADAERIDQLIVVENGVAGSISYNGYGTNYSLYSSDNPNWGHGKFPWVDLADASGNDSHILVREVEVPEPSTLVIFALGLLGLTARKLKKS